MKDLSYYKSKRFAYTLIVAAIFITAVFFFGMKDANVSVTDGKLEVKGIYGFKADIQNLKVDTVNSLPEISMRTNGFAGGGVLKGYFKTSDDEKIKLFIHKNSLPYIKITGEGLQTVYLNFSSQEKTYNLYNLLKSGSL
jgi:hypothetical protein